MQTRNGGDCGLWVLPPELVALVASAVEPDDLLRFCVTSSDSLSACRTAVVDWRMKAPEIEAVLPPRMSVRRFLSPLDVAWYMSATNVFYRKNALYAVMLAVNSALAFRDFMDDVWASTPEGRAIAGIPDVVKISTTHREREQVFFTANLSDIEAWARRQSHLAGFDLGRRQRVGDAPVQIIGPLGPHAAFVFNSPALFAVLDDVDVYGWGGIQSAAQHPTFIATVRKKVNKALTKALCKAVGQRADKRIQLTELMNRATATDCETPDTRGMPRPLDVRTKMVAFCEDVDLWHAYPDAEIYLAKVRGGWAAGVALFL